MASANTNTENTNTLSTDVFEIAEFYDQIRANNIADLDETAAMIGIFGYMNEMFTTTLQNALIVASETSNETIPTRAKFTKNVIAHAMNLGITDINATPAVMTLMIYLPTDYIEQNFVELNSISGRGRFILAHDVPIFVGSYEFHLDYDVILTRVKNPQGNYVYTGMYDLFETGTTTVKQSNPISNINNPYITTVIQTTLDGVDYVAFSARLHQVTLNTVTKNILTSSSIENKVVTFDFNDQLAAFDIDIIENDKTVTHLVPVYTGLIDNTIEDGSWCYYEYVGENTIRVLFDKSSYVPGLNATVNINVQLTEGANGNFTYIESFRTALRSETYNDYSGMYAYIYPLLNGTSSGGKDKKSVETLRKIIPREASSRGAVINTTDLQNFFNAIDNEYVHLYFKKKRDNFIDRLYYTYMLMRKSGNVYPTNTINLTLIQSDFKGFAGSNNLVLSPGTIFYYYDHGSYIENDFATIEPPTYVEGLDEDEYPYPMTINEDGDMMRVFEYMSPFLISIDEDLISSYFMTIMNDNKTFTFDSINTDSDLQFVSTNMNWRRNYEYEDENGETQLYSFKYIMTVDMVQNNSSDYGLVKLYKDANGETQIYTDDIRVKMVLVLYADETASSPYRYMEGTLTEYNSKNFTYTFQFVLETDDMMDLTNRINILGIYNCKPEEFQVKSQLDISHGYMKANTYAKLFIMADFGTKPGDVVNGVTITEDTAEVILYGEDGIGNRTELESIIPTYDDIVSEFLKNNIYALKYDSAGNMYQANVVYIMQHNSEYMKYVTDYNNNEDESSTAILRYLRNNADSEFVQDILLKDEDVIEVLNTYNYEDYSRYTVCNVMSIDGGIDFYHDYSKMMTSVVVVQQIQALNSDGTPAYIQIEHTDSLGNTYYEYKPIYEVNDYGTFLYNYTVKRIPVVRNGFLRTEDIMQDFVAELEERRLYILECIHVLEDTFGIDLKFFNTYGPAKQFYYNIPSSQNYKVRVAVKSLNIYRSTIDEDDEDEILGTLYFGEEVWITKIKGQWGCVSGSWIYTDDTGSEVEVTEGWIKMDSCTKVTAYIDNLALTFEFALEAESSADKYIANNIIQDIKEYIEDINEINELHVPNIITLITNNYREQLVYFEFMNVNQYGPACQHLYLDESVDADICPEFLNVATLIDGSDQPDITITVY